MTTPDPEVKRRAERKGRDASPWQFGHVHYFPTCHGLTFEAWREQRQAETQRETPDHG